MPVYLHCDTCERDYEPDIEQLVAMIRRAASSRRTKLVIHWELCTRCEKSLTRSSSPNPKDVGDPIMRCPEAGCPGYVCPWNEGGHTDYTCGECGSTWETRKALDRAVDSILERYDHRAHCYEMQNGNWFGVKSSKEPRNIEDRISDEA